MDGEATSGPPATPRQDRLRAAQARHRQLEPDRQPVLHPVHQRRRLVGVGDERWPGEQRAHRDLPVVDALTGEAEVGADVFVVELHRRRHLGDVVMLAQLLLLAARVADDEGIAEPVVVDQRPHLAELGPDPRAEVVLRGLVEPRADRRQRDLVSGHRIVRMGGEPDEPAPPARSRRRTPASRTARRADRARGR